MDEQKIRNLMTLVLEKGKSESSRQASEVCTMGLCLNEEPLLKVNQEKWTGREEVGYISVQDTFILHTIPRRLRTCVFTTS